MDYPEFPNSNEYTQIRDILKGQSKKPVKIRGWIYRTRSSGKLAFVVVRDSTGVVQCTVSRDKVEESDFDEASKALIESSVILEGEPVKDDRAPGGWEIRASKFKVFHFAEIFPITKDQSDEHLLNNRHLWLRSRNMVAALKIRSTVFKAFRDYWGGLEFTEIQSPSFTTSACEGGSTLFNVSYDDDNEKSGQKFYAHLSQSWQLYAEATMFGLENIFTIAPSFRAEKSRTRRHLTEFWHAEVESAWLHNHQMMNLEERMIMHILKSVLSSNRAELEFLGRDISVLENIKAPFDRMKYEEVLDKLNSMGFDLSWGDDFGYKEEKALTQELKSPLYITNFPKEKGFYHRPDPNDPKSLVCHDLLAPEGYGEIIGGGERVWSPDELIKRIREEGLEPESYGWYLDIRKFGSVPHSGFGLGIDRIVSWICGSDHIKHVIPFPRTMRRTTP
jgi:asparaginyl-tRNA synthetase